MVKLNPAAIRKLERETARAAEAAIGDAAKHAKGRTQAQVKADLDQALKRKGLTPTDTASVAKQIHEEANES